MKAEATTTLAIGGRLTIVTAESPTSSPEQERERAPDGCVARVDVDWDTIVLHLVHPTKVIIIETMLRIGRPVSATELKEVAEGAPDLSAFSFHLKQLARLGALEVVAKLKVRKSRSSKKETFFYFTRERQWVLPIARLGDAADPLAEVALRLAGQ